MTQALDLLKIAQEEQNGDLFKLLDSIYTRSKVQPRGTGPFSPPGQLPVSVVDQLPSGPWLTLSANSDADSVNRVLRLQRAGEVGAR